ncbi:M-phase phosphoprotein 9 isoform X2 [Pleurodeles waltl]|uniref:M-phase phosphoprotein 9 isoform X2 n=1 Tax=Pleurodeles waltl TaxID=8319 RepID=UPI003709769F
MEDADVMESSEHHPSSAEHTEPVERNEAPGLQRASGDASSPSLPGSVELLAAFMQDLQTSGRTDSEIWKNCEARWLQLFSLVEKQCQEQITAQQEQFHQQIQLIQDEIKHLVKLQSSSNSWKPGAGDPSTKLANNLNLWDICAGQSSGNFEGNRSIRNQCSSSGESEMGRKIQESLDDSISMTSGYGTISLSQPNPVVVKYEQNGRQFVGREVTTSKELGDVGFRLTFDGIENLQSTEKESLASKPDQPSNCKQFAQGLACSVTSEMHKVNESENSKCKPLTSWAHKMKRSQPKKPSEEKESCNNSVQRNGQVEKTCSSSSQMSFVGRKSDSPSSLFSDGSGLSYWKLDEKEMYHSLPETFEKGLSNVFSNNLATQQPNSASESKLQSLKVIYQNKLKEKDEWPAWSPPDQAHQSHPPEVWTLDPTIHMKPGHQNSDLPSSTFFKEMKPLVPFTPDSILESSSCSHSDRESFSRASNMNSPMLSGSPNIFSRSCASSVDLQRNHTFQNETNENANFFMRFGGTGMSPIESVIQSEDNRSSRTLTPTSDTQSLLHSGDDQEPEYNASSSSAENPVMLSRIRENLREKHARHISDLRDYYEAEIHNLKQQLDTSNNLTVSEELRQTNQNLLSRCDQLEDALTEASTRLRTLENKNNALEIQVADWRERFHTVNSTSNILQERFEEMRASNKEKDNTISRLKSRLKELEEAYQKSYKLSEEKDLRVKHEQKRFQDLLAEYESLAKEHERVKDTLSSTETKQTEASKEISELKRINSKLEAQLKQMEQDNMVKLRHIAEDHIRITNAKLRNTDVSRRKWLVPGSEYSPFTGQHLDNDQSILDNKLQDTYLPNRFPSPPEKDISRESFSSSLMTKKGRVMPDTPIMRAFKEFEDGKVLKSWGTQTEKTDTSIKALNRRSTVGFVDPSCGTSESPERHKGQKQTRRFGSPSGQRSSSLPPSNRRSSQSATPTKREIMLMPVSVKYSPKRSPRENFSPGLSELLSNPNSVPRFDVFVDDQHNSPPSFQGRSPRKKLHFNSRDDHEEPEHTGNMTELVTPGPSSEDTNTVLKKEYYPPVLGTSHETEFTCRPEMRTLDETERLFDALTQEKQRIEAALSRIPGSRGRLTLQAKYNKEALEDRLEKINRELGSIRMTLKKFHVLRTSANI